MNDNKMNESGISVIIPIYNAEKYIGSLLQSIKNQNFSDYEVLLIDDGSTDNSAKICSEYCSKDKKLKYFYTENSGVSHARNLGISLSKKKYILFLDADDYIEKNMFYELYAFAEKNACDVTVCGYSMEYFRDNVLKKKYIFKVNENMVTLSEHFCEELWQNSLMYNVWNRLIRKNLLAENNILFPDYTLGEDLEFNLRILYTTHKIGAINKVLYHYIREREGAVTSYRYIEDWFHIRKEENIRLWNHFSKMGYLKDKRAKQYLAHRYMERVLGCFENEFNKANKTASVQKYKNIKNMVDDKDLQKGIKIIDARSRKMKCMIFFIQHKFYSACYAFGFIASRIRQYLPEIFFKLKAER